MAIRSLSAIFAPVNSKRPSGNADILGNQNVSVTKRSYRSGKQRSRWFAKAIAATCVAAMAISATGCSLTSGACRAVKRHDGLDDFMIGYRNQVLAAKAWHANKHCHANRGHQRDFKAGFMQGYIDVANGSSGCVPSVAPASYWGWRYQSADGQNAVNAWFAGYPLGAQLAEQDGVNNWSSIRPTGAQAPQQRQAVFVPPAPVDSRSTETNPFYDNGQMNERYPYEPVQDLNGAASASGDDEIDSPGDSDAMDLEDAAPIAPAIDDAIREVLEPMPGDDSASYDAVEFPAVDLPYVEPPFEAIDSDQADVAFSGMESTEPAFEVIKPDAKTANADSELRFTFE